MKHLVLLILAGLLLHCAAPDRGQTALPALRPVAETATSPTPPGIDRLDPRLDALLAPDAELEQLAAGFNWSEGPVWVGSAAAGYLLFSDIPENKVYRWSAAEGLTTYLEPAGYTGAYFAGKEPGSNRLLLDPEGRLLLCQHGDRRMARMAAPLDAPVPVFETVTAFYNGKRLNSPNDAVFHENGDLYFTDPPYGLPGQAESCVKELDFQGVYRYSFADDSLTLLTDQLSRPNGIAFTPDYGHLIVANSDRKRAVWTKYPVRTDGTLGAGEVFKDVTDRIPGPHGGAPDGMAMHSSGNLFATGPGGIYILSPSGEELGLIRTGQKTGNCTFNADQSMLYITADSLLFRLPMLE